MTHKRSGPQGHQAIENAAEDATKNQIAADAQSPKFLTVDQCQPSLPIRISRRAVMGYIRAAGPECYQEHRRQLFLSLEQWAAVVTTMHPPGVYRRPKSQAEKAYEHAKRRLEELQRQKRIGSTKGPLSPAESAYAKALALTASDMPKKRRLSPPVSPA